MLIKGAMMLSYFMKENLMDKNIITTPVIV